MVAAGILSARGLVPPETITAALQLPYKISFPMVPAEGLYLKYAGFGRNADKVSVCCGCVVIYVSNQCKLGLTAFHCGK